jgi:multisubunit Na+/H+ antiporter MnhG subunit
MRIAIVFAVLVWLLSVLYLLITGEAGVIFFAGLIVGAVAVLAVAVAAIRSGRREKRMWTE